MKTVFSLFTVLMFLHALTIPAGAQLPIKEREPLVVTKFDEILKWLPPGTGPKKGVAWTQPQIDAANALFLKKLSERPVTLKMRVEIADIFAEGQDMVLFSSLTNHEGYRIRVFAKFPPSWKARLATVGKGEKVTVAAPLTSVDYRTQWQEFALAIGAQNSTFTK